MNSPSHQPMLSVRLMTYNHERFIEQAIQGVLLQQTNFPVELVIGDDFSTDRTLEIARRFEETATISIRILDRKKGDVYAINREKEGRLYNFKDIVNHCNGKYVALLDGDDYWTDPTKLQKQVDFLENNPEFSISFHEVTIVDDQNKVLINNFIDSKSPERTSKEIIKGAIMPTCTVVFRNEITLPDNFSKAHNGDTFLYCLLAERGKAFYHVNILNACYRRHDEGEWTAKDKVSKIKNSLQTYLEIKKVVSKKQYVHINRILASKHKSLLLSDSSFGAKLRSMGALGKYLTYYYLNKFFNIPV